MDDARIQELTAEVLAQLRGGASGPAVGSAAPSGLEARVSALERTVATLSGGATGAPSPTTVGAHVHVHPSLQLLQVTSAGGGQCVLEPDKPCVASGQCRTLGH